MSSRSTSPSDLARLSLLEGSRHDPDPVGDVKTRSLPGWVFAVALASAALVLVANLSGIAAGDDGVGYRAIADSILAGEGLRYFLEDPLTVWPPLWPALMALVARVTPLDTLGAAVLLNVATVISVVLIGHGLLRRVVPDRRLVVIGTVVMGLGASTIGFGHLLMTDLAFAVVVLVWLRTMIRFRDSDDTRWLLAASATVWLGFGLRYVAIYLLGLGGLWLLLDLRRSFGQRLRNGITYGLVGMVVPIGWMLRNRSIDGTFTGERMPSARGPVDNAFDILGAMGRWLLPGVADTAKYFWAAVGGIVLAVAACAGWRILRSRPPRTGFDSPVRRFVAWSGSASGLLAVQAFGYLAYMLYVRSTTALNQLELRLLNPAYFSLLALALVLVANLHRIPGRAGRNWERLGRAVVWVWAVANVAVGVYAAFNFAAGDAFFDGNYESDTFVDVRADPVLDSIPVGCEVLSNLPNALYPTVQARWSPRRTGLESNRPVDDLDELRARLREDAGAPGSTPVCLVWIDEEPTYGHLFALDELSEELELEPLASSDVVELYRVTAPS